MSNTEYRLRLEAEAAKQLIADMRNQHGADIFDGDEEFLTDTVEGETSLTEAINAALLKMDEEAILITGIEKREEDLKARKERLKKGIERKRSIIERAMVLAELKSLPLPTATVTLSKRAPGLVVTEEADVPSRFFVTPPAPDPRIDKKALTAELRARRAKLDEIDKIEDLDERKAAIEALNVEMPPIKGADLDNGGFNLQIRVK